MALFIEVKWIYHVCMRIEKVARHTSGMWSAHFSFLKCFMNYFETFVKKQSFCSYKSFHCTRMGSMASVLWCNDGNKLGVKSFLHLFYDDSSLGIVKYSPIEIVCLVKTESWSLSMIVKSESVCFIVSDSWVMFVKIRCDYNQTLSKFNDSFLMRAKLDSQEPFKSVRYSSTGNEFKPN